MNFKSNDLFNAYYLDVDKGKILNVDIWKYIPEVEFCLNYNLFNEWFKNKFCKWTQILDLEDFRFLCEQVESFNRVVIEESSQ